MRVSVQSVDVESRKPDIFISVKKSERYRILQHTPIPTPKCILAFGTDLKEKNMNFCKGPINAGFCLNPANYNTAPFCKQMGVRP